MKPRNPRTRRVRKAKDMTLKERYNAPTPRLFRRIALAGEVATWLAGVAGAVVAIAGLPVTGPIAIAAGVLAITGQTAHKVAKLVVDEDHLQPQAQPVPEPAP